MVAAIAGETDVTCIAAREQAVISSLPNLTITQNRSGQTAPLEVYRGLLGNNILTSSCDMIIIIMDKLTITSSTGILLAVSDYATLSDDVRTVVDGLLRTAVLGLEILGDVVADTLLSEELAGNLLLSCTIQHL